MSYGLGVDLGGTYCAAAASVPGRPGRPQIVPLATGSAFMPSVAFARPDGVLLVGEEAERQALTDPGRVARQFTRRVGDGTPLLVGGTAIPAEVLAARLISRVMETVAERERGVATRIAVTHSASWGPHRLTALRNALTTPALLISGPQAAALAHDGREPIKPGGAVAVYDLGGAGFEAAVLRKSGADRFTVAGRPEELELGGLDFDEVIFDHVRSTVGDAWDALDPADPAVLAAAARLRRECTSAKESLSADTDVLIPVTLPGIDTHVRLGRAEFEELIRPAVDETVAALLRSLRSAGVAAEELAAVLLVGGSARIPLVTQAVSEQLGRPVVIGPDPKGVNAIGAALAVREPEPPTRLASLPVPLPEPMDEPVLRMLPSLSGSRGPVGPPVSVGPPPSEPARVGFLKRLPRTVAVGAAGVVLAAATAVGGVMLANRTGPPPAGADTESGSISPPVEEVDATTTPPTTEQRPQTTTTKPRTTTTRPRTTTTTPPKTTTTTKTTTPTTTTWPTTTTPSVGRK